MRSQSAQLHQFKQPERGGMPVRPQRRRISPEQKRRIEAEKKRKKRKLFLERFLFSVVIVVLLLLYLDTKIQLKKVTAAISSAQETPLSAAEIFPSAAPCADSVDKTEVDYVAKWGMDQVDKPVQRSYHEVLEKLKDLSKDNELIGEILQNTYLYPDKLLEALANNPEMADFVKNYPDADPKATGGLTQTELEQEFPLFLQWDPRWGYAPYGDNSNIAISGCGPVSLSMALYYLTGDETLTPDKLASFSMDNGYYVSGTGTAWALITDVPLKYGVGVTQPGIEEQAMKQELDRGNVLIASMKPGDFTAAGHFLVIYGYDKEGFKVNDPNCVARSRKSWTFDEIGWQIKSLWSLGKDASSSWKQRSVTYWEPSM